MNLLYLFIFGGVFIIWALFMLFVWYVKKEAEKLSKKKTKTI